MTPRPQDSDLSDTFRSMPEVPDFSESIMARVERRRGFLGGRGRSLLRVARWGVAAVALGFLAGSFLLRQSAPVAELTGRDTSGPAARVVAAVAVEGPTVVREASDRVIEIGSGAMRESMDRALRVAARRASLRLESVVISVAPPHAPGCEMAPPAAPVEPVVRFDAWAVGGEPAATRAVAWPSSLPSASMFQLQPLEHEDTFTSGFLAPRR
jgi:hypothetical protein